MFEFPDPEGGKQEALCPGQCSHRRQFSLNGLSDVCLPRTAALRLGFANTARGFADGEMAGVVHDAKKSSFQATAVIGEMEWWSNGGREAAFPAPITPLLHHSG